MRKLFVPFFVKLAVFSCLSQPVLAKTSYSHDAHRSLPGFVFSKKTDSKSAAYPPESAKEAWDHYVAVVRGAAKATIYGLPRPVFWHLLLPYGIGRLRSWLVHQQPGEGQGQLPPGRLASDELRSEPAPQQPGAPDMQAALLARLCTPDWLGLAAYVVHSMVSCFLQAGRQAGAGWLFSLIEYRLWLALHTILAAACTYPEVAQCMQSGYGQEGVLALKLGVSFLIFLMIGLYEHYSQYERGGRQRPFSYRVAGAAFLAALSVGMQGGAGWLIQTSKPSIPHPQVWETLMYRIQSILRFLFHGISLLGPQLQAFKALSEDGGESADEAEPSSNALLQMLEGFAAHTGEGSWYQTLTRLLGEEDISAPSDPSLQGIMYKLRRDVWLNIFWSFFP